MSVAAKSDAVSNSSQGARFRLSPQKAQDSEEARTVPQRDGAGTTGLAAPAPRLTPSPSTLHRSGSASYIESENHAASRAHAAPVLRLTVTPPRDIAGARLRIEPSANVRFAGHDAGQTTILWRGPARRGQALTFPLRPQTPIIAGTVRVILEEAVGATWKPVREQILAVPGR
jgi:hypothetical protein